MALMPTKLMLLRSYNRLVEKSNVVRFWYALPNYERREARVGIDHRFAYDCEIIIAIFRGKSTEFVIIVLNQI